MKLLDIDGLKTLCSLIISSLKTKSDKATTLNGYGITDAYTKTETDNAITSKVAEIVNENNNGSIDTLNEIANWIISDTTGAAKMASDIESLKTDKQDASTAITTSNIGNQSVNSATNDSAGQQINATYIKSMIAVGTTITYTKGNGNTGSVVTQDTITTATTTGTGNAVTSITADNGALSITKGATFLTEHQDISGKADRATSLAGYGINDAYTKNEMDDMIGDLTNLETSSKDNLVTAINELKSASGSVTVKNMTSTTATISPNIFYVWGEVTTLDITLATPTDTNAYNEYMFQFTSGSTATTLSLPTSISWEYGNNTISASKTYQVSIVNNLAVLGEF